mgnify:CR=1 FL=1
MNKKVQEYIKKNKPEYSEKEKLLISQGLYDRKYYEGYGKNAKMDGYKFFDRKAKKYYRKEAIEVSDYEYKEISEIVKNKKKNLCFLFFAVSLLIFIIGVIITLKLIKYGDFISAFVYGTIFSAFSAVLCVGTLILKYFFQYKN